MELQKFVMYCLRACTKAENNKEIWMHQAVGAVQYHINLFPEEYEAIAEMWNGLKPHFESHIWGTKLSL